MNSTALFSEKSPLKLFFLASIPGAVSMLASALYQTIDGVFVGRFLGATAFAAARRKVCFRNFMSAVYRNRRFLCPFCEDTGKFSVRICGEVDFFPDLRYTDFITFARLLSKVPPFAKNAGR